METNQSPTLGTRDAAKRTIDLSTSKLTPEEAIKCLTGEYNVLVPTPNAKPCNNLDEYLYKSTVHSKKTSRNDTVGGGSGRGRGPSSSTSRRLSTPSEPFAVPHVRNFERILKKSINGTAGEENASPRRKKSRQDVFTKTDQIDTKSGPLSHLKDRLNQTVKVMIRRRKKVPYISRVIEYKGTLTMFDKHMNVYLKDVIESFNYQRDGKLLKRGRHREGIVIRGDNVILVA